MTPKSRSGGTVINSGRLGETMAGLGKSMKTQKCYDMELKKKRIIIRKYIFYFQSFHRKIEIIESSSFGGEGARYKNNRNVQASPSRLDAKEWASAGRRAHATPQRSCVVIGCGVAGSFFLWGCDGGRTGQQVIANTAWFVMQESKCSCALRTLGWQMAHANRAGGGGVMCVQVCARTQQTKPFSLFSRPPGGLPQQSCSRKRFGGLRQRLVTYFEPRRPSALMTNTSCYHIWF